jgi:hypothetical protein
MINIIARVRSISGIFTFTISREFNSPTINEAATAAIIAMKVFCENHTNMEITIAFEREATEPTDKSNPFTASETVMPMAMIVTIEMDRRMLMMLFPWINDGLAMVKTAINTKIVKMVPYLYKN